MSAGCDCFNEIPFQGVQIGIGHGVTQSSFQRTPNEPGFPALRLMAEVNAPAVGAAGGIGPHFSVRRADEPDQLAFGLLVSAGDATAFGDVALFRNQDYPYEVC